MHVVFFKLNPAISNPTRLAENNAPSVQDRGMTRQFYTDICWYFSKSSIRPKVSRQERYQFQQCDAGGIYPTAAQRELNSLSL